MSPHHLACHHCALPEEEEEQRWVSASMFLVAGPNREEEENPSLWVCFKLPRFCRRTSPEKERRNSENRDPRQKHLDLFLRFLCYVIVDHKTNLFCVVNL
ncbi:hypothetical protein MRB53_028251 [Persea americana]|uniref:Uncharacterized protein n=1 Tax=Persea americana TaxID=3435 RepID=A0ACC2KEZ7_PERAE|nr:hypothetical protein MRB53_028251 [Persea americana]